MWNQEKTGSWRTETKEEARVSARLSHMISWDSSWGTNSIMPAMVCATFQRGFRVLPRGLGMLSGMLGTVSGAGEIMRRKTPWSQGS